MFLVTNHELEGKDLGETRALGKYVEREISHDEKTKKTDRETMSKLHSQSR